MNKSASGKSLQNSILVALTLLCCLSFFDVAAQGYLKAEVRNTNCPVANHQADRWFFGQNAGLDFRPQDPIVDLTNDVMNVPSSPAIIADSTGNILFFTDGARIYNRQSQVMPNGDGLHGFAGSTMPVIIIPRPGSPNIYYVFTVHRPRQNQFDNQPIYGFEYNEVDLTLNSGLGDVTIKNKVLLSPEISSKLTAIRHSNGIDYWVLTHRFNSNEFCAFRVTENGVDTANYVSSSVGTAHLAPGETNNGIGYMKISPDGTKLALAIHGSGTNGLGGIIEIFNFNASTGVVSSPVSSGPAFENAFGVEFSSDSRYLYVSTTSTSIPQPVFTPPSYLFQFDVALGNSIFNIYDTIAIDTLGSYLGGLQLGTDGRIYVSRSPYGNAAISVIDNPKRPGQACNFRANAIDLAGFRSRFGLPNFMQSYFDLPHFDVENICYTDNTVFTLQNNSNIDNVSWQFGDSSGSPATSTDFQPSYVFTEPGTYPVQVTEFYQGVAYGPYIETVIVNELPQPNIGDTVYMYPGSPILLDAGEGFTSYEWSTGENTQVVRVDEAGTYWVTVQNEKCCFNIDSVVVIFFDVLVPNAFRPGGSNNIFRAYPTSEQAINNFALYVYNRWGQQIFVSNDINTGWDGRVNGKDAPGDVYVWLVNYDVEREGRTEKISYKGNVILLR